MDSKTLLTLGGVYSFYDKELSEFAIEIWADALKDYDPTMVREAFQRHMRDPEAGRWLPKPADIIRQLRGDVSDRALIAWGEVIAAARSGGGSFGGATRQALDSMGGMGRIRMSQEAENGFLMRQFVAAFKAYANREEAEAPLLEATNVLRIKL
jgi:hypothetical protein